MGRYPKFNKAEYVARRLVTVERAYDLKHWAVTIRGWRICGYDQFVTKAEAQRGRDIVVDHLTSDLYKAGVS